jgi:hypothetical protein
MDLVTLPSIPDLVDIIDSALSPSAAHCAQVEGEPDLGSTSGSRAVKLAQAACGLLPEELCGVPAQVALHMLVGAQPTARPYSRTGRWESCAGSSGCVCNQVCRRWGWCSQALLPYKPQPQPHSEPLPSPSPRPRRYPQVKGSVLFPVT